MNDSKYVYFGDCISIMTPSNSSNLDTSNSMANIAYCIYGNKQSSVTFDSVKRFGYSTEPNSLNIYESSFVIMPETSAHNSKLKKLYQEEAQILHRIEFDNCIKEIIEQQQQKSLYYNQKFRLYHPASRSFLAVKSNKVVQKKISEEKGITPGDLQNQGIDENPLAPNIEENNNEITPIEINNMNQPQEYPVLDNGGIVNPTIVGAVNAGGNNEPAILQEAKVEPETKPDAKGGKDDQNGDTNQKLLLTMVYSLSEESLFEVKETELVGKKIDLQVQKIISLKNFIERVAICKSSKTGKETFYLPSSFKSKELTKSEDQILLKKEVPFLTIMNDFFFTEFGFFRLRTIIDNQIFFLCCRDNRDNEDKANWFLIKKEFIDQGLLTPSLFSIKNNLENEKVRNISVMRINPNHIDKFPHFISYAIHDINGNSKLALSQSISLNTLTCNYEGYNNGSSTLIFMNIDHQLPSKMPVKIESGNPDLLFQILIPSTNWDIESSTVLTYPDDLLERETKEITEFNEKPCWYNKLYNEISTEISKQNKREAANSKVNNRNEIVNNYNEEIEKKIEQSKIIIPITEKNLIIEDVEIPEILNNKEFNEIIDDDLSEVGVDEVEEENNILKNHNLNEFETENEKSIVPIKAGKIFSSTAISFNLDIPKFTDFTTSYMIKSIKKIIETSEESEIKNCIYLLKNIRKYFVKNKLIQTELRSVLGITLCELVASRTDFSDLFPIIDYLCDGHYYNNIWLLNKFPLDESQIDGTKNIKEKEFRDFIMDKVYIQNKLFLMSKDIAFVEKDYLSSFSDNPIELLLNFINNELNSDSDKEAIQKKRLTYEFKINNFSIIFGGGKKYGYNTQDFITYFLKSEDFSALSKLIVNIETSKTYPILSIGKLSGELNFQDENIPYYTFLLEILKINIFMYSNERYYYQNIESIYNGSKEFLDFEYLFNILSEVPNEDKNLKARANYLHSFKMRVLHLLDVLVFSKTLEIPYHLISKETISFHEITIQKEIFNRKIIVDNLRDKLAKIFNPYPKELQKENLKASFESKSKEPVLIETERDELNENLTKQKTPESFNEELIEEIKELFLPSEETIRLIFEHSKKSIRISNLMQNLEIFHYVIENSMLFDGNETADFYLSNLKSLIILIQKFDSLIAKEENESLNIKYSSEKSFLTDASFIFLDRLKMLLAKKLYSLEMNYSSNYDIEEIHENYFQFNARFGTIDENDSKILEFLQGVTGNLELSKNILEENEITKRSKMTKLSFEIYEIPKYIKRIHEITPHDYKCACDIQNTLFSFQEIKTKFFRNAMVYQEEYLSSSTLENYLSEMKIKLDYMLVLLLKDNNEFSTYNSELGNYQFCYSNKIAYFVSDYTSLNNKDILNFDFRQELNKDLLQIFNGLNLHQQFYKILIDFFDVYDKLNLDYKKLDNQFYERDVVKIMSQIYIIRTIITKILCLFIENSEENAIAMKETIETDENLSRLRKKMLNKEHNQALLMTTIIASICKTMEKYSQSKGSISMIIYLESLIEQTFKSIENFSPYNFSDEERKTDYCRNCVFLAMYFIKIAPGLFKYRTLIPFTNPEKNSFESISEFIANFYYKFLKFFNEDVYYSFYNESRTWRTFNTEKYDFQDFDENRLWFLTIDNNKRIDLPMDEVVAITHTFIKNMNKAVKEVEDNKQAYDFLFEKFYNKYSKEMDLFSSFDSIAPLVLPLRLDLKQRLYTLIIATMFDGNRFSDFNDYHNIHILKAIEGMSIDILCWFDHLGIGLPSEMTRFDAELANQFIEFRNKDSRNSKHFYRKHVSMMIEEKAREKDPSEISASTRHLTRILGLGLKKIFSSMNLKDRKNYLEIRKGNEEGNFINFKMLYVILFQSINNSKIDWAVEEIVPIVTVLSKFRSFLQTNYMEFESYQSFEAFMKLCEVRAFIKLLYSMGDLTIAKDSNEKFGKISDSLIKETDYKKDWPASDTAINEICKRINEHFNNNKGNNPFYKECLEKITINTNEFFFLSNFFENYANILEKNVQNIKPSTQINFSNNIYYDSIKSKIHYKDIKIELKNEVVKYKSIGRILSYGDNSENDKLLPNDALSLKLSKLITKIKIEDLADQKIISHFNVNLRLVMDFIITIKSNLMKPLEQARIIFRADNEDNDNIDVEFEEELQNFKFLLLNDFSKNVVFSTNLIEILVNIMSVEYVPFKTFSLSLIFLNLLVEGYNEKSIFQEVMSKAMSKLDTKSKNEFGENIKKFLNETWEFIERDEKNIKNWLGSTITYNFIYLRLVPSFVKAKNFYKNNSNEGQAFSLIHKKDDIEEVKSNTKFMKENNKNILVFKNILGLIKNLCENHNEAWKMYFFEETKIFPEIILKRILVQYSNIVSHLNLKLGMIITDTVLEILQGQNKKNILPLLISGEIYIFPCKIFGICGKYQIPTNYCLRNEDKPEFPFSDILDDRSNLLTGISEIIINILEFVDTDEKTQLLRELTSANIIDSLNKSTISFFKDVRWLAKGKKELNDSNKIILVEKKIKNTIFKKVNLDDVDFLNYFIPLINYFIILKILYISDQQLKDSIIGPKTSIITDFELSVRQKRVKIFFFLKNLATSFIHSIEILDEKKELTLKYFPKYIQCYASTSDHTASIIDGLDRTSYDTKIGTFFSNYAIFNKKMEQNYLALSTIKSYFKAKTFKSIEFLHFSFALILNALLLDFSALELNEIKDKFNLDTRSTDRTIGFGGLVVLQVFLAAFVLLSLLFTDPETHFNYLKNWETVVKRFFQGIQPLRNEEIVDLLRDPEVHINHSIFQRIMLRHKLDNPLLFMFDCRTIYYYIPLYIYRIYLKIFTTILDHRLFLYVLNFIFCILSLYHPLFVPFQILFQVMRSKLIRDVFRSLYVNVLPFFYSISLAIILILLYSMIGYFFLNATLQIDDDKLSILALKNDQNVTLPIKVDTSNNAFCETLWECFLNFVNFGLRSGGGVGAVLSKTYLREDNQYGNRWIFDFSFYILLILIMLNLIFGIIINTFTKIRDKKIEDRKDQISKCFICDMEKVFLDKVGDGFDYHYKKEHNMWDYFYYLYYLQQKGIQNLNIFENYVWLNFKKNNYQWIPMNQALCVEEFQNQEEFTINNALTSVKDLKGFVTKVSLSLETSTQRMAEFNRTTDFSMKKIIFDARSFANTCFHHFKFRCKLLQCQ